MRVLILDDQSNLAQMLARSLGQQGFPVIHFTSPSEALEHIQENDILVTDYHMREMTGLEMAQKAHAQGWRGAFLLMSGRITALDEHVMPPFLNAILRKPFSTDELVRRLHD